MFERSRAEVARFEWIGETGSTNDELRIRAVADPGAWPELSVLVTDDQTAGRGRLGRRWIAPTGKTLAISLLVRPSAAAALPADAWGWLPLLAGVAMAGAVADELDAADEHPPAPPEEARPGATRREARPRALADADATQERRRIDADGTGGVAVELKWPNDVLISGYKVCGVLSELVPADGADPLGPGAAVIVGAGLNLTLDEHDLPTITSTSLRLVAGADPDADRVLAGYLRRFGERYRAWLAAGADAEASGLAAEVRERCGTLGRPVRVELPGGGELIGTAVDVDASGRLLVDDEDGIRHAVAAGDVTHVRS